MVLPWLHRSFNFPWFEVGSEAINGVGNCRRIEFGFGTTAEDRSFCSVILAMQRYELIHGRNA
jgi:hypothetical protein